MIWLLINLSSDKVKFSLFPYTLTFVKVEYFLYQSEKLQRLWTPAPLQVSWSRRVSKLKLGFIMREILKINRTLQNRKIFQHLNCESSCKGSSIVYIWPALLPWGQVPASFTFPYGFRAMTCGDSKIGLCMCSNTLYIDLFPKAWWKSSKACKPLPNKCRYYHGLAMLIDSFVWNKSKQIVGASV